MIIKLRNVNQRSELKITRNGKPRNQNKDLKELTVTIHPTTTYKGTSQLMSTKILPKRVYNKTIGRKPGRNIFMYSKVNLFLLCFKEFIKIMIFYVL